MNYRCIDISLLAAFVAVAACIAPVPAQSQPLPDVVRETFRGNPEILAAAANVRASREGYEQAAAGQLPSVDLRVGSGREGTDNTVTRALGQGDRWLTRQEGSLTLRQNLYDASQVRSQMESQQFRVGSTRARLAETGELIAFRVTEAYLDALRDRQLIELARANVARHETTLEKVRLRFQSGVGQRADVEQAEARLSLARSSLVTAEGNAQDTAARYERVVGRTAGQLLPPESPAKAMPAGLDAARTTGAENSYGIRAAQDELNASQSTVRATRADLAPRVDVELTANRNRDIDGVPGPQNDNTAMLVFRYNLFRGGADQARVREAMERETVAIEALRNAQRGSAESVTRSWAALVTARDRLAHLEGHVRAIEQVLGAYVSQFELGRRTLLDVLNAGNELFQAQSALTSGRAGYRLAEYRLLAAMGTLVRTLGLAEELAQLDAPRER